MVDRRLMGVYLMGVYLTAVHLMGMYFINVHLSRASHECVSWADVS